MCHTLETMAFCNRSSPPFVVGHDGLRERLSAQFFAAGKARRPERTCSARCRTGFDRIHQHIKQLLSSDGRSSGRDFGGSRMIPYNPYPGLNALVEISRRGGFAERRKSTATQSRSGEFPIACVTNSIACRALIGACAGSKYSSGMPNRRRRECQALAFV